MLVGEVAELDGEVSAVGIENQKVEPAAGLGEMIPAKSAYTVPKTNAWRPKKNDDMRMVCRFL